MILLVHIVKKPQPLRKNVLDDRRRTVQLIAKSIGFRSVDTGLTVF